ncbi:MAG: phosphomannomutase [Parcubacteria group bacterium Gr01-1014_31]|nr:MAG: phosphomannomutase [Parcubacteria group bacterium Gr01-1014_31]
MSYNPAIFKAYDIRGVYPTELDEDLAQRLGRALVTHLRVPTVAVGWDVRESGPKLRDALVSGITAQGADAILLGVCSTDSFYFAVTRYGFAAGVMVSASHNPAQYNGFKIVGARAAALSGDSGIPELKQLVAANHFPAVRQRGTVREQPGVIPGFAAAVRAMVKVADITPLKVVMDTGNGSGGLIAPSVFDGLPLRITPLCFAPDGRFPNHQANPLLPENRVHWEAAVREQHADLGIAWDADTDRVFFLDEQARFIPGDFVTALLAGETLDATGGGHVVYDLRASRCVPDTVRAHGGTPVVCRVGHSFIKAKMRELDGVFGGEITGHYYYRFSGAYLDNGWIPALQMITLRSRRGKPLSEMFSELAARYHISGEHNYTVADPDEILAKLEAHYGRGARRVDHLDGLTIERDDFWFNVRKSNTEPLLRLNLEATSAERLPGALAEVAEFIRRAA